jgi:hypothetical protein
MSTASLKQLPDTTGCSHAGVGLDTPCPRKVGNFELGYCLQCKQEIAFRLDSAGKRTGETLIVKLEENIPVSKMRITKIGEDRYRVEVKERLIEEDVNDVQFLGMARERTIGITADEILSAFEDKRIGDSITVDYT